MIDLSFVNNNIPEKGKLLLSDPFMDEEFFRRAVVYICEYSEGGSFGFIINNFLPLNLKDLGDKFPDIEAQLSIGGPVDNDNLYFLHTLGDQIDNAINVTDQVYLGGNFDQLIELLKNDSSLLNQVRFFIGYAGWSKVQLEDELKENNWLVVNPPKLNDLFVKKTSISWKKLMKKQGEKFKFYANTPLNPSNN